MVKLPDITLAQILAVFGWIVAQAVAYGFLDSEHSQVLLSAGATVIAAIWKLADAWLRTGRNNARAAALAAGQPDPAATTRTTRH
jgi:uncharacterized membrane protein